MNFIKQSVGIDVDMKSLVVRFGTTDINQNLVITNAKTFKNTKDGHKKLLAWALKIRVSKELPLFFVMEATGIYYENLAYFLIDNNQFVSVILPNKIKNYSKSLENKSKTDPIDAAVITRFALERKLNQWTPSEPIIKALKALSREYHTLKELSTEVKAQLHAKEFAFDHSKEIIKRKRELIKFYDKQINQILNQIKKLLKSIPELKNKIDKIESIKGVGFITVLTIIAETNCFEVVTRVQQLVSYAGLDVMLNQSGKKKGKSTISKKGNKFIRTALYMHAISAARHNPKMKLFFNRLIARGKSKKAAYVAIARKLLLLIYALWKNDSLYDPNYNNA